MTHPLTSSGVPHHGSSTEKRKQIEESLPILTEPPQPSRGAVEKFTVLHIEHRGPTHRLAPQMPKGPPSTGDPENTKEIERDQKGECSDGVPHGGWSLRSHLRKWVQIELFGL